MAVRKSFESAERPLPSQSQIRHLLGFCPVRA
jgi:hypothetical protein